MASTQSQPFPTSIPMSIVPVPERHKRNHARTLRCTSPKVDGRFHGTGPDSCETSTIRSRTGVAKSTLMHIRFVWRALIGSVVCKGLV
jgi:hypothetical protein